MAVRSVAVQLRADVSGYVASIRKASAATKDFAGQASKSAKDHKAEWDKVGNAMLVTGGVIAAGVGYAVKSFMDFDKQMSGVRAVTGATSAQMSELSDAALKAGADTVFSASDAARAEAELAKAGVSVNDILTGGLIGSMNLAAAGQIDLADAATISAQAMNIFSLKGKDVGHIADVLTAGANKSAAGVDDLGQALRQGGLVASQTGLSFEETVGTLSAFADSALIGSDAGTSLKTMLQRLTPQSQQAADEMRKLGFSAYDAKGNFVGMPELAGRLQKSFGDLTPQARNAALAVVFGSDAVRGANVIMKQGAGGIREYIKAVDDQGAAQRMASIQMDNLAGDVENLKGSLDTLFIKSGGAGNDFFRGIVQNATAVTNFFGNLPGPVQDSAFALSAVAAAALLSGGAVIKGAAAYKSLTTALDTMGISAARATVLLKGLGAAAAVAGVAFAAVEIGKYAGEAEVASTNTDALAKSIGGLAKTGNLSGEALKLFAGTGGWFQDPDKVMSSAKALDEFGTAADGALGSGLANKIGRLQSFGERTAAFNKQVTQLDGALATMVANGHAKEAARTFDALMKAVPPELVDEVKGKFVAYGGAVKDAGDKAALAKKMGLDPAALGLEGTGQKAAAAKPEVDAFGNVLKDVDGKATDAKTAVQNLANSIRGLGNTALDASGAEISFQQAIDDATKSVKDNGRNLNITTAAGRANRTALNQIATSSHGVTAALVENNASTKQVTRSMHEGRAAFITAARAMGASTGEAKRLADQAGFTAADVDKVTRSLHQVPRSTTANIHVNANGAILQVRQVQAAIDALRGRSVTITTVQQNVYNRIASGRTQYDKADGGVMDYFADGAENHVAQIAPAGAMRVWAEPETGGEAYIPLAESKRARSEAILEATAARFGKVMVDASTRRYASGALVSYRAPAASAPAGPAAEMRVYVQNPWTGEYLEARTVQVADARIQRAGRRAVGGRNF